MVSIGNGKPAMVHDVAADLRLVPLRLQEQCCKIFARSSGSSWFQFRSRCGLRS